MKYILAALFILSCAGYVWRVEAQLRRIAERSEVSATQLVHKYISGGEEIAVVTTRRWDETKREWMNRHLADIEASWSAHPPDGE